MKFYLSGWPRDARKRRTERKERDQGLEACARTSEKDGWRGNGRGRKTEPGADGERKNLSV